MRVFFRLRSFCFLILSQCVLSKYSLICFSFLAVHCFFGLCFRPLFLQVFIYVVYIFWGKLFTPDTPPRCRRIYFGGRASMSECRRTEFDIAMTTMRNRDEPNGRACITSNTARTSREHAKLEPQIFRTRNAFIL